jgi:hypothetical protein
MQDGANELKNLARFAISLHIYNLSLPFSDCTVYTNVLPIKYKYKQETT